ncbi:hypothetical protein ACFY0G_18625 [Streptomyces sp. NPDC001552]|uniref:hypothetical protein n=1 Tax=Streptomyces sp. NPDC001552 TaxID=3364587 RepID=UPI0036D1FE45
MIAWTAGQLRLAAGHDLTYHHGLELVFDDPVFVSCPSSFHDPTFRAASPEERLKVSVRSSVNRPSWSPSRPTPAGRNLSRASSPPSDSKSSGKPS